MQCNDLKIKHVWNKQHWYCAGLDSTHSLSTPQLENNETSAASVVFFHLVQQKIEKKRLNSRIRAACSTLGTPHSLLNPKWPPRSPWNCWLGKEEGPNLGYWALRSTNTNMFFNLSIPSYENLKYTNFWLSWVQIRLTGLQRGCNTSPPT